MKYLTQILDKPLVSSTGEQIGKIVDAIATLEGRLPSLQALVARIDGSERYLRFEDTDFDDDPAGPTGTGHIPGDIRLRKPLGEIHPYVARNDDLRLRRDVLDKQIVDVQDYRVVRVSDVRLAECGEHYCVVGVDASLRAALRRLGSVSRPIEAAARLAGRPLRSNLIAWDDVETLEAGSAGGRIRLKVSHDKIAQLHPADIADIVEQLSPQQGAEVIEALDTETAAEAIAEAEPETQVSIMQQLDEETATDIITEMEPDDAADLLDDLPDAFSDKLLGYMGPDEAEDVKELMAYDEDTAGGLMTTELVAIPAHLTCDDTINRLRELAPKAETIYYVYVVDDEERLVGVLSLRDLVIAAPSTLVSDVMVKNVIHVYVEDHADQVAQIIGRYNLLAVPVVSEDEKLLGIITVDDTMERLLPPERRRRLPVPALSADD
jgi:CBS domain-containing protein